MQKAWSTVCMPGRGRIYGWGGRDEWRRISSLAGTGNVEAVREGRGTVWGGARRGCIGGDRGSGVRGGRRAEDGGQRTEDRGQRTEDRGRRTEDRGQRTEVRGRRTEDGGRRTEDGGRRTEVRGQMSEVTGQRSEVRGHRSEVTGQRSEVRGHRSEDGGIAINRGKKGVKVCQRVPKLPESGFITGVYDPIVARR